MSEAEPTEAARLGLFEATGVEIEYMIVGADDLDVRPIADRLIAAEHGSVESEIERGAIAWSNELALHVIELKTNGPAETLEGLPEAFQAEVERIGAHLAPLGARLLPTGAHPWMDPEREFRIWPHEYGPVYHAFDRIFGCRGHGWANLQSTHINLPFADADEFGRLHAAIRCVLPLLPALAASTPVLDGRVTGILDTRLETYRHNARAVPSVAGDVIPERVFTPEAYEREVLARIFADLAPHDPEGVLRHDWVNARGCIPRFERGSIEIRVLDTQECPAADLAIVAAVVATVRALVEERLSPGSAQRALAGDALRAQLLACIAQGEAAPVPDATLRAALGVEHARDARSLWRAVLERLAAEDRSLAKAGPTLELILEQGCLARRMLRRLGERPDRAVLARVYRELADALAAGELFRAPV